MQDYFKTHLDACNTSVDSKKNRDCCIHRLKCNKQVYAFKQQTMHKHHGLRHAELKLFTSCYPILFG